MYHYSSGLILEQKKTKKQVIISISINDNHRIIGYFNNKHKSKIMFMYNWFKKITIIIVVLSICCETKLKKKHTITGFDLEIIQPEDITQNKQIFVSGKLSKYYNPSVYMKGLSCTNGNLQILEFQQLQGDQLITFKYSGIDLLRKNIQIKVQPNLEPYPELKDLNRIYKTFTINAKCPEEITQHNYYNRITINIADPLLFDEYSFSFLLNCDWMDFHKNFQFGYVFISIICCVTVFAASLHPRIYSLRIDNVPLSIQIRWKSFLVLMILALLSMLAIYMQRLTPKDIYYYGKKSKIQIRIGLAYSFLKHIGLILSSIFIYIGAHQTLFEWPFILHKINFIRVKIFGHLVSNRIIVSIFLTFILYIISLIFQSWLLYNTFSLFIVIGSIKIFRFYSLKNAAYSMLVISLTVLVTSVWVSMNLPRSYNDYASQLSSPLFLQVPDLVNNLYKKCSWISVFDLIFPGAVLAYLREYDQNLQTHWSSGAYSYFAMGGYTLGMSIWVFVQAITNNSIPYCVVVYPIFIGSICLVAGSRNQFDTIWYGRFHYSMDLTALQIIQNYRSGKPAQLKQMLDDSIFDQTKINQNSEISSASVESKDDKFKHKNNKIQ